MAYYTNFVEYINCSTTVKEKIARINAIIEALEDAELEAAVNAGTEEYWFDDGQTKVKAINRDIGSIEKTIQALIRRRTRLINGCIGYRYGLMDGNVKV
jgi:hypothetical protein